MQKNECCCDCTAVHADTVRCVSEKMADTLVLDKTAEFFKVLGDSTRMKILWALYQEELCVCDIASVLHMTKSAVSHQLAVLRTFMLVTCRRDGKTVYYSLADAHVSAMIKSGMAHANE